MNMQGISHITPLHTNNLILLLISPALRFKQSKPHPAFQIDNNGLSDLFHCEKTKELEPNSK